MLPLGLFHALESIPKHRPLAPSMLRTGVRGRAKREGADTFTGTAPQGQVLILAIAILFIG